MGVSSGDRLAFVQGCADLGRVWKKPDTGLRHHGLNEAPGDRVTFGKSGEPAVKPSTLSSMPKVLALVLPLLGLPGMAHADASDAAAQQPVNLNANLTVQPDLDPLAGLLPNTVIQNACRNDVGTITPADSTTESKLQALSQFAQQNVLLVQTSSGIGSAWLCGDINNAANDVVITNAHVVGNEQTGTLVDVSGNEYAYTVIGVSPPEVDDIAVLRLAPNDLARLQQNVQSLPIATPDQLQVGQSVVAAGNPFGNTFTVTSGIISALNRQVPSHYGAVLQSDAAVNPGNSGGTLLRGIDQSRGLFGWLFNSPKPFTPTVAGMNSMIYSPSGAFAGITYAVMPQDLGPIITLIKNGVDPSRVVMGVTVINGSEIQDGLGSRTAQLQQQSAAAQQQLNFINGIIQSLNDNINDGKPLPQQLQMFMLFNQLEPPQALDFFNKAKDRLTKMTNDVQAMLQHTQDAQGFFSTNPPQPQGVYVLGVAPGSLADASGIQPYDQITGVNGQPVQNIPGFQDNLAAYDFLYKLLMNGMTINVDRIVSSSQTQHLSVQVPPQLNQPAASGSDATQQASPPQKTCGVFTCN